jgi:hypothetical protein
VAKRFESFGRPLFRFRVLFFVRMHARRKELVSLMDVHKFEELELA